MKPNLLSKGLPASLRKTNITHLSLLRVAEVPFPILSSNHLLPELRIVTAGTLGNLRRRQAKNKKKQGMAWLLEPNAKQV